MSRAFRDTRARLEAAPQQNITGFQDHDALGIARVENETVGETLKRLDHDFRFRSGMCGLCGDKYSRCICNEVTR